MASEMLTRVAKVLLKNRLGRAGYPTVDPMPNTGDLLDARAAIEAMREPTQEMIEMGWQHGFGSDEGEEVAPIWRAMIDEALR